VRLVLDTNTVVSGLLWNGTPSLLLDAARRGDVVLYTSPMLLAELARVLGRRKFASQIEYCEVLIEELIEGYAELAFMVLPGSVAQVIQSDPDDDHVLACALAARADLIVSGDNALLALGAYQGIQILRASEALHLLSQGY
jgi:uncharacterized protein